MSFKECSVAAALISADTEDVFTLLRCAPHYCLVSVPKLPTADVQYLGKITWEFYKGISHFKRSVN